MSAQSLDAALALAAVLFVIGLAGIIARRSLVFMLLCTEIMLNAARLRLHRRRRPMGTSRRPGDVHLPASHGRRRGRGRAGAILSLTGRIKDLDADEMRSGEGQ